MIDTAHPRPLVPGLMTLSRDGVALLASRCKGCHSTYFPRTATCRNPGCASMALVDSELCGIGTLYSFTIQRYRPPPLFRMDDWQPYAVGTVEFPQGIRVMGMLRDVEFDEIRIGQPFVLHAAALYVDEHGTEVQTHVFKPASPDRADL